MSTTARKARKRAGVSFVKPQKVGTPFLDRSWLHDRFPSKSNPLEIVGRSEKSRRAAIEARGIRLTRKQERELFGKPKKKSS